MTGAAESPEGAETDFRRRMSYSDYLKLDLLLHAQAPLSTGILLDNSSVEVDGVDIEGANVGIEIRGAASPTLRGDAIHDCIAEGILIAQEMLETARPMVQGVQVSAPFGRYTVAAEVLASVLSDGAITNRQDTIEGTSVGKL